MTDYIEILDGVEVVPYTDGMDLKGITLTNTLSKKEGVVVKEVNVGTYYTNNKTMRDAYFVMLKKQNSTKTLSTANVIDSTATGTQFWGNDDTWKLISKAWNVSEGWMKSTKAMDLGFGGVALQVSSSHTNPDGSKSITEAITTIPDGFIKNIMKDGRLIGRVIRTHRQRY